MVNWREDVEFVYAIFVLVSSIVVFFSLYDTSGATFAAMVAVPVLLVEAGIGFVAFETDRAIALWERIEKQQPAR